MGFETPAAQGLAGSKGAALVQYEKQLSIGAIGSLWLGRLARGSEIGRLVTVRRIPLEWLEPADIERARLAAGAYARLKNPSLVKLLEVTQAGQELICVSEYLAGVRLSDLQRFLVETESPMPTRVAVRLVLETAKAALLAHRLMSRLGVLTSQRVVFSDGVLIALFGETLLTDVGVLASLLLCSRVASLPSVIANLSPEEILNPDVACGSPEVFTLGVMLWELLSNRWLFSRHLDTASIRKAAAQQAIVPIDTVERLGLPVPKPVARLVEHATQRDPRKRIGSLEAFVEAVQELPSQFVASIDQLGDCIRKFAPQILPECDTSAIWPLDAERGRSLVQSVVPAAVDASELHNWDPPTFAERQLVVPIIESSIPEAMLSEPVAPVFALSIPIQRESPRKRTLPIIVGSALFLTALVSTLLLLRQRRHLQFERATAEPARSAVVGQVGSSHPDTTSASVDTPAMVQDTSKSAAAGEPLTAKSSSKPKVQTSEPSTRPAAASRRPGDTPGEPYRPHKISPYHPKGI